MSDILKRLKASIGFDVINGSRKERAIFESQVREAITEIESLRAERDSMVNGFEDLRAELAERDKAVPEPEWGGMSPPSEDLSSTIHYADKVAIEGTLSDDPGINSRVGKWAQNVVKYLEHYRAMLTAAPESRSKTDVWPMADVAFRGPRPQADKAGAQNCTSLWPDGPLTEIDSRTIGAAVPARSEAEIQAEALERWADHWEVEIPGTVLAREPIRMFVHLTRQEAARLREGGKVDG